MRNFLVALAVFIIVVVGIGTLVTHVFHKKPAPAPVSTTQTVNKNNFSDKATKVRLITDGAIVGLENHRSIRITVDSANRKIEVLRGYDEEVIREQSFANDSAAFTKFLAALDGLGYTKENPKASKDERGSCPLGLRYIYETVYSSGDPLRTWSTSCGGLVRLQGNTPGIQQLFHNQIPGYSKLIADVNLRQL